MKRIEGFEPDSRVTLSFKHVFAVFGKNYNTGDRNNE